MTIRSLLALGLPLFALGVAPFVTDAARGEAGPSVVGGYDDPVLVVHKGVPLAVEDLILDLPPEINIEVLESGEVVLAAAEGVEGTFVVVINGTTVVLGEGASLRLSLDGSASYQFQLASWSERPLVELDRWTATDDIEDTLDASPDRSQERAR